MGMRETSERYREEERLAEERLGITHEENQRFKWGFFFWLPLCVVSAVLFVWNILKNVLGVIG